MPGALIRPGEGQGAERRAGCGGIGPTRLTAQMQYRDGTIIDEVRAIDAAALLR